MLDIAIITHVFIGQIYLIVRQRQGERIKQREIINIHQSRCMLSPNQTPIARAFQTADNSLHRCLSATTPPPLWYVGCSVKWKLGCRHELPDEIELQNISSPWIRKGVSATSQSGRYTPLCQRWQYLPVMTTFRSSTYKWCRHRVTLAHHTKTIKWC